MIHDISVTISEEIVTWPGDPAVSLNRVASIEAGDVCNVTSAQMGVHTGTHIDAPFHFVQAGKTVEEIALETCYGPAIVVEVSGALISKESIEERIPAGTKRVLFKTANSELWARQEREFDRDFIAIDSGCATYLVELGIELVGVDYLSVESFYAEEGNPVHKTLLEAGTVLLEGCNLSRVETGEYTLAAFPLKLEGVDGSPCRAVLIP